MCGIIGIVGKKQVAPLLLEALKRLEYRGYDSAGIATLDNGGIERRRSEGKISKLEKLIAKEPIVGKIGIGHTRWATHGAPNEINAHPHSNDRLAVVHNGIIENFYSLKEELQSLGFQFTSETDSEVIIHLITHYLDKKMSPRRATERALKKMKGSFALGLIFSGERDLIIGAKRDSPLVVGYGDGEMYLGSDEKALAPLTETICFLEEGDLAEVRPKGTVIYNEKGKKVKRPIRKTAFTDLEIGKGSFPHFMLKEIYEQPTVVGDTLHTFVDPLTRSIKLADVAVDWKRVPKISIIACGTSSYASMVAKYWFEEISQIPVETDIASEFRYRKRSLDKGGVIIFVSQSGETADTIAALRKAKQQKQFIISIVNVAASTIARESDVYLLTNAGPEIGVASTKAFTTQLTVLACLAIHAARERKKITAKEEAVLTESLMEIPSCIAEVLNNDRQIQKIAKKISKKKDVLYLGRSTSYPIAMEGALKLKEISYIHAEGYAAGEMKHGPIALIQDDVPVIIVAPGNDLFDKTMSNAQEVLSRGGKVILLTDQKRPKGLAAFKIDEIILPKVHPFVAPILYSVPVQLLAYHAAVDKGTDVDQPRNLAKSVTVE